MQISLTGSSCKSSKIENRAVQEANYCRISIGLKDAQRVHQHVTIFITTKKTEMNAHKEKKAPHHLSRDASAAEGWVESLTSLTDDVQATQLLDEGSPIKV